ncbi:hypothetical protein AGMMS4952_13600 [Spirochaetia bacterium]|nr:hypothetical protein AGMMS4952_13600 [Spirochaetia bacterium]
MAGTNSNYQTSEGERTGNIEKLATAPDITLDGNAYRGKYELNKKSIVGFLKNTLRKEVFQNNHMPDPIRLGGKGIDKLIGYGLNNDAYKKLFVHIPEIIKNAVFITDEIPTRADTPYNIYRHLVTGIALDGEPYTIHVILGENSGVWYYDHILSKIEKGRLLSVIRQSTPGHPVVSPSSIKDTTLLRILQAPLQEKNLKGDTYG